MKSSNRNALIFAVAVVLLFACGNGSARPAPRPDHPAYLHALSDLRDARAHLQRPGGGELKDQEKKAIHEIDEAIKRISVALV